MAYLGSLRSVAFASVQERDGELCELRLFAALCRMLSLCYIETFTAVARPVLFVGASPRHFCICALLGGTCLILIWLCFHLLRPASLPASQVGQCFIRGREIAHARNGTPEKSERGFFLHQHIGVQVHRSTSSTIQYGQFEVCFGNWQYSGPWSMHSHSENISLATVRLVSLRIDHS